MAQDASKLVMPDGTRIPITDDKMREMTSDAYSDSSTYAVGDYCIYDNKLYRCTTAITTAGAWDSSKWVETQIGDEFSELKSSLSDNYTTLTIDSSVYNTMYTRNIFKFGNLKIANVQYLSKAITTLNSWIEMCSLPTGYENLHALEFQWFTRDKKSINLKVESGKIYIVARESVGNNDLISFYIPFI